MKQIKRLVCAVLVVLMVFSGSALAENTYTAGTYTASANGNNGPVTVEVVFSANAIERVNVTEHSETAGICDVAIERIPQSIVDGQTLAVDVVSGATNSSKAILAAVENCVLQAGGDVEMLKQKRPKTEHPLQKPLL